MKRPSTRIANLDEMARSGMYMSDLGLYGSSQEMVLSGIQSLPQLEYARDQVGIAVFFFYLLIYRLFLGGGRGRRGLVGGFSMLMPSNYGASYYCEKRDWTKK